LNEDIFRAIIDAVEPDGFRPRLSGHALLLVGSVVVRGRQVPVRIEFDDLTLSNAPRLMLPDTTMLERKVVPHVDELGELCAVNRQLFVFDRYRSPELTRGLIVRAREVLERGMTKEGTREIAEEFESYWSTGILPVSAGDGSLPLDNCCTLTTNVRLTFAPDQARPTTLGELIDWVSAWDSRLGVRLLERLARLNVGDPTIIIHSPNASIAATLQTSGRGPAFLKSLSRPQAWARFVQQRSARCIAIQRLRVPRCDIRSVLGRDKPDGQPLLAGKRIVLVGCGAIGGYLARMLAQLGAGLDESFVIIDSDTLSHSNIRRHQLGMGDATMPKAQAVADAVGRDFPGLVIQPVVDDATRRVSSLLEAELVIDATGEQGFSEWLNELRLSEAHSGRSVPAALFVWIAGAGQAAQAFMVQDEQFACYRCLQPDHGEPSRFDPLKAAPPAPVASCGEQPSTPYGPAAPSAAASLALTAASDWANGNAHPLLRTLRIDWRETVKRDPCSPQKSPRCPACGKG
jgi:molybdopterin/thiamine biosynthesis adenylyltransferase